MHEALSSALVPQKKNLGVPILLDDLIKSIFSILKHSCLYPEIECKIPHRFVFI
jgi:hypothetical protein